MELLGEVGHVWFILVRLDVVSVQDRCTVCAKHTIGSEIVVDAPDVLLGDEAQAKAHFGPFGDCDNLNAR
jgi:hypothetical protein